MLLKSCYHRLCLFIILCRTFYDRNIVVFDIDETICLSNYSDYRLESRPIDSNVDLLRSMTIDTKSLFLSARPLRYQLLTMNWLKRNNIDYICGFTGFEPKDKLWLLRCLNDLGYSLIYMDDLSYKNERGEIVLHDEIIELLGSMNIKYIGFIDL